MSSVEKKAKNELASIQLETTLCADENEENIFEVGYVLGHRSALKELDKEFSYVIGSYWESGAVNPYAYGKTVFRGTMEDAEEMRIFISDRAEKEMKIFKLVEIETT